MAPLHHPCARGYRVLGDKLYACADWLMRIALVLALFLLPALASTVEVIGPPGLNEPFGVAFGQNGDWFICEYQGQKVVRVDKRGNAVPLAGTGSKGYSGDNGPANEATLRDPHGIVLGGNQLYIADTLNHVVRTVDLKSGRITTLAGSGTAGFAGDGNQARSASFNGTFAIDLEPAGRTLYVADLNNRRVRAIDLRTGIAQTVAGNGTAGVPQDGASAANSPLTDPRAVAADNKGNLYILERGGNALRVVNREGKIHTLVGPGTGHAALNGPKHLCIDPKGGVVIADAENNLIQRYNPSTKKLAAIAGTGKQGKHLDASDPLKTELARPHGVAFDQKGNLFISDSYNGRIIKIQKPDLP
jgi:streptogramin lyase